jgi:hypothetical protein
MLFEINEAEYIIKNGSSEAQLEPKVGLKRLFSMFDDMSALLKSINPIEIDKSDN